ncbi:high affinity choline transporter 1-like [Lineus longissimus]|uniref:high affinity choline transporter 1-like n=1 Tax=Lineus longissimus TaxID=88925 RepID=UPI002B4DB385
MMPVSIAGLAVLAVFYLIVLIIGIVAAKKFKTDGTETKEERFIVAGRNISTVVGVFTMTATTVGGGFINGTAESVATFGLAWTLAPPGIFIGLVIGGAVFAKTMRERKYLTMLDPFQERYGDVVVTLLYLAAICGDIFWSASILAALGTSLSVITDIDVTIAIVVSAAVGVIYTLFGQMVAVAYTDIVQLTFIIVGLVLSVPFAMTDDRVQPISGTVDKWVGTLDISHAAVWADLLIAMTLGSIPWQAYFQRVLSMKSARNAQLLSVLGGLGAFILAIPPVLIGVIGVSADWNKTDLGASPIDLGQSNMILPHVIHNLTPKPVAIIGLCAIAAAVMSSMDSAVLGSSSMFTHNIYKPLMRKKATQTELSWVQRIAVFSVAAIATVMSLFVTTIYGLFILAADFVYVILFPQLVCVLFVPRTNTIGAVAGYLLAVILRIGAGEPFIALPALIKYPFYNDADQQLFPFRTFAMVLSLLTIVFVSHIINFLSKWQFWQSLTLPCLKKQSQDVQLQGHIERSSFTYEPAQEYCSGQFVTAEVNSSLEDSVLEASSQLKLINNCTSHEQSEISL